MISGYRYHSTTGLAKTRVKKKTSPVGFIGLFWVLLVFFNIRPIKFFSLQYLAFLITL
jgi:hypothetical protein